MSGAPVVEAQWNAATSTFDFRAPMEPVVIKIARESLPFQPLEQTFDLHSGLNELSFVVRPPMGLRLWLMEDDRVATVGMDLWRIRFGFPAWYSATNVRGLAPDGKAKSPVAIDVEDSGALLIQVAAAGPYEVELPKITGYEVVPSFTIDVPYAQYAERRINLKRERP